VTDKKRMQHSKDFDGHASFRYEQLQGQNWACWLWHRSLSCARVLPVISVYNMTRCLKGNIDIFVQGMADGWTARVISSLKME